MADRNPEQTPSAFSRLETLTAVAVLGVLALALGLASLAMPSTTTDSRQLDYTQQGEFTYSAETPEGSVYGSEGLSTGEPIVPEVVGPVTASFRYVFESGATAELHGTAALTAEVEVGSGLSRTFPVVEATPFSGAEAVVSGELPLAEITRYAQQAAQVGSAGAVSGASVRLVPDVQVEGALDGRALETEFGPELSFILQGGSLTPSEASGDPDPSTDPLEPSEPGTVDYEATVDNTVPLLVADPPVQPTMIVAFSVAGVCLLLCLLLARPLRAGTPGGEETRIRALYGSLLVEVGSVSLPKGPVADVASMEALVDVAKKYESVIMHLPGERGDDYMVWDNGLVYRYRSLHSSLTGAPNPNGREVKAAEPLLSQATAGPKKKPRR